MKGYQQGEVLGKCGRAKYLNLLLHRLPSASHLPTYFGLHTAANLCTEYNNNVEYKSGTESTSHSLIEVAQVSSKTVRLDINVHIRKDVEFSSVRRSRVALVKIYITLHMTSPGQPNQQVVGPPFGPGSTQCTDID